VQPRPFATITMYSWWQPGEIGCAYRICNSLREGGEAGRAHHCTAEDLVAICILNSYIDLAQSTYLQASHTLAHIRMWNPILLPAILLALATAAPLHKRDVSPNPNPPSPPPPNKEKTTRPTPTPPAARTSAPAPTAPTTPTSTSAATHASAPSPSPPRSRWPP
jgi:hypothetical protein